MGKDSAAATVTVEFTAEQIEAIDAWIARSDLETCSREEAVRQIVAGRLGAHGPHTMMPDLVTGRDIV